MIYKTETHLHTSEVSRCGKVPADIAVEEHIKAGYNTIVVTDHFSLYTYNCYARENVPIKNWEDFVERFFLGYELAKKAANGRINVLFAIELRFNENSNDYLIYGVTKDFLLAHPDIFDMGIKAFKTLASKHKFLVIQAHPFRNDITIVEPCYIDGVEVHNGNPRWDSRNEIAQMWANKYNLIQTSGTDYHEFEDLDNGGILTEYEIKSMTDLKKAIKNGAQLIK